MSIKKAVVFFSGYITERGGGPPATPFNLHAGLLEIGKKINDQKFNLGELEINFLSRGIFSNDPTSGEILNESAIKRLVKSILMSRFFPVKLVWVISRLTDRYRFNKHFDGKKKDELKSADFVHIHRIFDYDLIRKHVSPSAIKAITLHTPESITKEFVSDDLRSKCLKEVWQLEKKAIEWADVLIYPCSETLEGHFKPFPYLAEIVQNKEVIYCPLGIKPLIANFDRKKIRMENNIPDDAFVVSYVGRHNTVKGFDLLANAVIQMNKNLKIENKIYLLSAGKGEMVDVVKGYTDILPFWRHLDWINSPADIMYASDCFVLPNRDTFFDLVLLEALSVGLPVVATDTGGNKYIGRLSDGVRLCEPTVSGLETAIKSVYLSDHKERMDMAIKNKKAFDNNFSQKVFADNYINSLKSLLG